MGRKEKKTSMKHKMARHSKTCEEDKCAKGCRFKAAKNLVAGKESSDGALSESSDSTQQSDSEDKDNNQPAKKMEKTAKEDDDAEDGVKIVAAHAAAPPGFEVMNQALAGIAATCWGVACFQVRLTRNQVAPATSFLALQTRK
jgi:hypothetical protein